jgi:pilus assembly protein CpaB
MNRSRLLLIASLALALGAFVSLLVYKNLQSKNGSNAEANAEVIVAANDLQVGHKINETDIKIIKIPASAIPGGTPRRRRDVLDHAVIMPISAGEFILNNKLAGENAGGGLPSLIPPGMRAVSVRVTEVVSVAGFVTPGTRVDVLLTGTPTGATDQQTTTVLQNVLVIAAGHTLERNSTGEAQNTPVITLLVSPDDAQRVTLASSEGHIQLVLRSPIDTKQETVAATNSRELYKGLAPAPSTNPAPVHHAPVKKQLDVVPAPAPNGVNVEVYQGDKKPEVVKFPDESPESK